MLECHRNFEEIGFHWHLLIKGVAYVPHEILKEGWRSVTHGSSYIVHIEAVRRVQVIGYVTKYLIKSLSQDEKGTRKVERERTVYKRNKQGKMVKQRVLRLVDVASGARRIRYSRQFFPEKRARYLDDSSRNMPLVNFPCKCRQFGGDLCTTIDRNRFLIYSSCIQ